MTAQPVVGRIGAVLAMVSVALHVMLIASTPTVWMVVMLALAAVCLLCAWHLWTAPTTRTWILVAMSGAAMLVVHAAMMRPGPVDASPAGQMGGHHGAHGVSAAGGIDVMTAAMVVTAAEVTLAIVVVAAGALARRVGGRATGTGSLRTGLSV